MEWQFCDILKKEAEIMKMLVVYYSWSNGNTERIAKALASSCNANLLRLETEKPYEGTYNEVVDQALDETKRGWKPALKPLDKKLSGYDTIAVGTPTWWYTMAPAVLTFLSQADLAGRTVIPFMTNAGWPGHVIKDMTRIITDRGGSVKAPFEVTFDSEGGSRMQTEPAAVEAWIRSLGQKP